MHLGSNRPASSEGAGRQACSVVCAGKGCCWLTLLETPSTSIRLSDSNNRLLTAAKQGKQPVCYGFPTPTALQQQEACSPKHNTSALEVPGRSLSRVLGQAQPSLTALIGREGGVFWMV